MASLPIRSFSAIFLFFTLVWAGPTTQAQNSFTVTSLADTGPGTLRQALADVDGSSLPGQFTVTFGVSGTINLAGTLNAPTKDVLIIGQSGTTTATILKGGGPSSNFSILSIPGSATLSVRYLAFADGHITGNGGAILLNGGTLRLTYCYLYGNSATYLGGAIHQGGGSFTITNSTVASNTAISNSGALHKASPDPGLIDNCTFSGNVGRAGGAIEAAVGSLTINNSTFTQNRAVGETLMGDPVSGAEGGAIYGGSDINYVTINNCLIVGNTSLGTAPDLVSGFDSNTGYNLIGNTDAPSINPLTTGNVTGVLAADVLRPTLATNSGPTPTHAILSAWPVQRSPCPRR